MAKAKIGDKVKVHYTGYLENGTVFESTVNDEPAVFIIGDENNTVLPGIEKAVIGMQKGETKSVSVPPEDAYGPYNEKLLTTVERSKVAKEVNLEVGLKLNARTSLGILKEVYVRDISDRTVTVDTNHPLAGKVLDFEILLVGILRK